MLQRGDTFGAYRIVARLKAGGMAQLYLARREGAAGFKRPVALKVIHEHLAREEEFVGMFVDEATLSSKIHDPNVVHVEDLGHANGGLFLAMEYVHGAALANVLRAARTHERRLAPALVAYIAAQVASGLHAAHEVTGDDGRLLGIVHRDVSPQNVLIAFKGHVKVIDFGIAKALGGTHASADGAITGKLAYMPPEQALGQIVDRRTDVYALGIVAWEMLAGRRLFSADNDLALVEQVRNPIIGAPSRHAPGIPPALDAVVMRMLARDARSRPATALDVKRMLLDAVPEARSVEAHDVAALLRALLPEQIAAQDKVLASADLGGAAPASRPGAEAGPGSGSIPRAENAEPVDAADLTETDRIVEPVDALHQLTVAAVVLPSPHARAAGQQLQPHPRGNAPGAGGAPPSGPLPSRADSPRASSAPPFSLLLVLVFVVVLGGTAFAVKRLRAPSRVERDPPAAAADTAPPVAPPPPTSSPGPSPVAEPAVASAPVPVAPVVPIAPAAPPPAPVTPAALTERRPPRAVPRPARPASPAPATSAPSPPKPHCRMVGGVELCE